MTLPGVILSWRRSVSNLGAISPCHTTCRQGFTPATVVRHGNNVRPFGGDVLTANRAVSSRVGGPTGNRIEASDIPAAKTPARVVAISGPNLLPPGPHWFRSPVRPVQGHRCLRPGQGVSLLRFGPGPLARTGRERDLTLSRAATGPVRTRQATANIRTCPGPESRHARSRPHRSSQWTERSRQSRRVFWGGAVNLPWSGSATSTRLTSRLRFAISTRRAQNSTRSRGQQLVSWCRHVLKRSCPDNVAGIMSVENTDFGKSHLDNSQRPATAIRRSDLARLTGCNLETIRYYETIGIMPDPPRTSKNYRVYDQGHVRRLKFVMRSRELGFGLEEIRGLLALVDGGVQTCGEVQALANTHLGSVRARIADLRRIEDVLASTVARCTGGDVPECPVIDTLSDME